MSNHDLIKEYCNLREISFSTSFEITLNQLNQQKEALFYYVHCNLNSEILIHNSLVEKTETNVLNLLRLIIGILPKSCYFTYIDSSNFQILIPQVKNIGPSTLKNILQETINSILDCANMVSTSYTSSNKNNDKRHEYSKIEFSVNILSFYNVAPLKLPKNPQSLLSSFVNSDVAFENVLGNRYFIDSFESQGIVSIIDPSIDDELNRIFLELFNENSFKVYYQPIIDLESAEIIGFEALARFIVNGKIYTPGKFLPVFIKNNLMEKFDLAIVEKVVSDILFIANSFSFSKIKFSLNLSGKSIESKKVRDKLINIVSSLKLPNGFTLQFEILEDDIGITNSELNSFIGQLKEFDTYLAIDDFGVGYSTFMRLIDTEIYAVKLDRFFVTAIDSAKENKLNILKTFVRSLTQNNQKVIAEGIETKQHLDFILSMGVEQGQGYYFHRPQPLKQNLALLEKSKSKAVEILNKEKHNYFNMLPGIYSFIHLMVSKIYKLPLLDRRKKSR